MDQQTVLIQVQDIFRTVFEDSRMVITAETAPADIHNWDSLTHVLLISKIEKSFGVKFSLDDMLAFENVGDICKGIIGKKPFISQQ